MFTKLIFRQFSRLSLSTISSIPANTRTICTTSALEFKLSAPLCGEPLKKKKKIDPAVVKAREERRRKKIEKHIRRLQKNARQLKPIDENEMSLDLLDQLEKRKRPPPQLTAKEIESRYELNKEWMSYKRLEHMSSIRQLDRIMKAQRRALDQLYEVSEDLYDEAVMPDLQLVPYSATGPVATPPIKNYDSPDGEYIDVSKKWDN